MMALSKCVLDRVEKRKNELKGRMYGLVEIMSRSVFARMQKRTSLYKDLLDQLVEQVFNKFTQELNEAWRDGCAHGRDWELSLNQHINQDEEYVWDSEIEAESLSITTLESQTSSSKQSLDDDDDDDDNEEYYSIMAPMDGVDQCVLDRVKERKNNFKSRAYGLMEIISRTVFARMEKRTSVYKDLLDQLVEQVFNKFLQELNDVWRDGWTHGRDEWNVYSDFGDSFEDPLEMDNLDLIEPLSSQQQSPLHSNENSSLHSSPTQFQPSSQSQHQNINQQVSDSGVMTYSVPISSSPTQASAPQQSIQECKLYEELDDGEYTENNCDDDGMGSMCTDDQDKEQSEEYDRDDQINANVEKFSLVNGHVNGDGENDKVGKEFDGYGAEVDEIDEDDQHGVDQLNVLEHRNNNIDGNEAQKGQLAQNKSTGQVAVSDKSRTAKLVCEHCGKGFKTRYNLTVHIRTHTGDRPYKFPKCPKTFNLGTHMKQHIMSRHNKLQIGKHVCAHCARRFPSQSKLENHIRTHTGERPHKCPFNNCNKAFAQIGAMQLHYTRVHTEHRLYVCELCGNGFKTGHNLAVHTRTHTGDQTPYKCPKCVQTFNLNSNMKKHLKSQHGKLKHLCTHCDRAFQSQFKLEIHIRMHTGHKLFVCTWENCRNAYIQIQNLKDHMCSHTGEKAHKCPWKDCTKVYTHSSNCHKHFKNHIDKIPFKCPWEDCHEEFAQLKHFRVHAKHHTGNRPVKKLRSEDVEGESDEGRIINNHVQGDESSFENALPIGNEKNLLSVNGEIDDDDGDIEMVNEIEPRENQLPIQNMPNIHQPVISNKCSRTVERPCPFAWGGCTKTFTDDGHLLKHLGLIHSHHHSSKHQNSNKDDQYVMDSENDEVGESEIEDMDEQQIGNGEELPMADDLHRNEHGDCQLNGHKLGSNIEGADTRRDQLAQNIQSGQVVVSDKPPKGKHVCEHCGKGFKQPSALTRHIRMHTGERPHVCPHENCAKAFTQIGAMRIHHRIHTGERPHVCEQCGKTFPTNSCLTRHIRIHTLPDPTNVITAD